MKRIDLVEALDAAFPPSLVRQLAGKFGFPPKIFHHVLECSAPIFVTALVAVHVAQRRGQDGSLLLDTVLSPQTNENIVEQFSHLTDTTSGMKMLENAGQTSVARGLTIDPGALGDFIAREANVPEQATYAMTGLIATALFGILKQHLLDSHAASLQGLEATLAEQWPTLEMRVTNPLARFLRFASAARLRREVNEQLHGQSDDDGQRGAALPDVTKEKTHDQVHRVAALQTPTIRHEKTPSRHWGLSVVVALFALVACMAAGAGVIWWLQPSLLDRAMHGMNLSGRAFAPSSVSAPVSSTSTSAFASVRASASDADAGWAKSVSGPIRPEAASAASAASASAPGAASVTNVTSVNATNIGNPAPTRAGR